VLLPGLLLDLAFVVSLFLKDEIKLYFTEMLLGLFASHEAFTFS
jgi:hypothetical protein